ncbi:unnamed protein product, partial [Amoebophrya sp. A25]
DESPVGRLDCLAMFGPLSPDGFLCQSICLPGSGLKSVNETRRIKEAAREKKKIQRRQVEQIRE